MRVSVCVCVGGGDPHQECGNFIMSDPKGSPRVVQSHTLQKPWYN